jgi:hypothetical protein
MRYVLSLILVAGLLGACQVGDKSEGGAVERAGPPSKPTGRIDAQVFGAFHKASRTGF